VISSRRRSAAEVGLWRTGSREIVLDRPIVAGILNVTPDSFSDGGNFFSHDLALEHAERMLEEGADIIDIGGESTRPGARVVPHADEISRVVPVISAIRKRHSSVFVSIDTTKASVARAAIKAGADIVNDVSAMRIDPDMPNVIRESGCGVVLMHSRGGVEDMASYEHAVYEGDATDAIIAELADRTDAAVERGIDRDKIVLDPGFGFSKLSSQSMALLTRLEELVQLGFPVMVGISRKRFVTEALMGADHPAPPAASALPIAARDGGTVALNVQALMNGASLFRVHNVGMNRRALDTAWALRATAG
jgi:dihydropteroate synthase